MKPQSNPIRVGIFLGALLAMPFAAAGGEPVPPPVLPMVFGLNVPTLGGVQPWTDELIFHDLRVQKSCQDGRCRLLDAQDQKIMQGSYDECVAQLNKLKAEQALPPLKKRVVVLIHGLVGHRSRMNPLARYLKDQSDYEVLNFGYASTQGSVAEHSQALGRMVSRLDGVEEINFVGHSLGNILVRHYLADVADPKQAGKTDPRIKRIVMLAPPNQGAVLADKLKGPALEAVFGRASRELGPGFPELKKHLCTPNCEFGIIAACCQEPEHGNPLIAGENDLVVSIEETKLPGASDFMSLPALHQTLAQRESTHEAVLRFLQRGYFVSDTKRERLGEQASRGENKR